VRVAERPPDAVPESNGFWNGVNSASVNTCDPAMITQKAAKENISLHIIPHRNGPFKNAFPVRFSGVSPPWRSQSVPWMRRRSRGIYADGAARGKVCHVPCQCLRETPARPPLQNVVAHVHPRPAARAHANAAAACASAEQYWPPTFTQVRFPSATGSERERHGPFRAMRAGNKDLKAKGFAPLRRPYLSAVRPKLPDSHSKCYKMLQNANVCSLLTSVGLMRYRFESDTSVP
jgi:hypothetical protein